MKACSIFFQTILYTFMAMPIIEMVEMSFQKKIDPKKVVRRCYEGVLYESENFFRGRICSEGHFDHFYGSHGHKSTNRWKGN